MIGEGGFEPLLSLLLLEVGVPTFLCSPSLGFVEWDLLVGLVGSGGRSTASGSGSAGTLTGGGSSDIRFL